MKKSFLKSKYNIGIMALVAVLFLATVGSTFGFVMDAGVPGTRVNFVSDAKDEFVIEPGLNEREVKTSLSIADDKETTCEYKLYLIMDKVENDLIVETFFNNKFVKTTNFKNRTLLYEGSIISSGSLINQTINVNIKNNSLNNVNGKLTVEEIACK